MIGIKYKQGKFTQLESERVAQALEKYRVVRSIAHLPTHVVKYVFHEQANGLSNDSLTELMYAKRGQQIAQREKFWQDISGQLCFTVRRRHADSLCCDRQLAQFPGDPSSLFITTCGGSIIPSETRGRGQKKKTTSCGGASAIACVGLLCTSER